MKADQNRRDRNRKISVALRLLSFVKFRYLIDVCFNYFHIVYKLKRLFCHFFLFIPLLLKVVFNLSYKLNKFHILISHYQVLPSASISFFVYEFMKIVLKVE